MHRLSCLLIISLGLLACSNDEPATLQSTDDFQATNSDFGPREEMPGAPLYAQHCAHCHDGSVPKAPHFHLA